MLPPPTRPSSSSIKKQTSNKSVVKHLEGFMYTVQCLVNRIQYHVYVYLNSLQYHMSRIQYHELTMMCTVFTILCTVYNTLCTVYNR